jgi:hypothetical protein
MIITIKPEDIIKRCLWSSYKRYVLKNLSEDEINTIITLNQPTVISEDDAFVIGLIKVIETDNLIHRFNLNLLEILQIKSNLFENILFINKNIILKDILSFKTNFPVDYKADPDYVKAIEDVLAYIDNLTEKIMLLPVKYIENNDKTFEYYNSTQIKKLLAL